MYKNLIETVKVSPVVLYYLYFSLLNSSMKGALADAVEHFEDWIEILSS